jgi:nitrite reductase/ring-hydroxylating ferredoxin subunit
MPTARRAAQARHSRQGGVGPDGDIVAFSVLCPHKGWLLSYNGGDKSLNCPGHHSRFDCEAGGQQIWGHATHNLPQFALRVDDAGDIYADGRGRPDLRPPVQRALRGNETMAFKRQIDRLPIIPADAQEFNVTCHYCIVGCGYKAYTWPMNRQGGTRPTRTSSAST